MTKQIYIFSDNLYFEPYFTGCYAKNEYELKEIAKAFARKEEPRLYSIDGVTLDYNGGVIHCHISFNDDETEILTYWFEDMPAFENWNGET